MRSGAVMAIVGIISSVLAAEAALASERFDCRFLGKGGGDDVKECLVRAALCRPEETECENLLRTECNGAVVYSSEASRSVSGDLARVSGAVTPRISSPPSFVYLAKPRQDPQFAVTAWLNLGGEELRGTCDVSIQGAKGRITERGPSFLFSSHWQDSRMR